MHHQHAGQFPGGARRTHQRSFDLPIALRRRNRHHLDFDALVVLRHLLRPGVIGLQALPNRGGSQATHGELLSPFQEGPPVHSTVYIFIEKIQ
jgi:hypothetical protein